jgi:hypothetical protein
MFLIEIYFINGGFCDFFCDFLGDFAILSFLANFGDFGVVGQNPHINRLRSCSKADKLLSDRAEELRRYSSYLQRCSFLPLLSSGAQVCYFSPVIVQLSTAG